MTLAKTLNLSEPDSSSGWQRKPKCLLLPGLQPEAVVTCLLVTHEPAAGPSPVPNPSSFQVLHPIVCSFLIQGHPASSAFLNSPSSEPSPHWGPSCSEGHSSALQCPMWSLSTLQGQRQTRHLGVPLGTWALQAKNLTPFPWMLRH